MDNFYNTANRMYKSSKILHGDQDFHNSCYLAGYVIECYIKIMHQLLSGQNPPLIHNIAVLNSRCLQYIASGNSSNQTYFMDSSANFSTILQKWNPVNTRYCEVTNELIEQDSISFQNEVELAMKKIAKMKLDGHNLI
jgi:hypothetical protein